MKIRFMTTGIVVLCICVIVSLFFINSSKRNNSESSHEIPAINRASFCKAADLQNSIEVEGAAGSIYGKLRIKNISADVCKIIANGYISPKITAINSAVVHAGIPGAAIIILKPGESAYSQVHYPNGPQCNGPEVQSTITFSYQTSANESVIFKDQSGRVEQNIMVCSSPSQITQVDVWSISTTPISG